MEQDARNPAIERLGAFVGEWRMDASLPDAPAGTDVIDFGGISIIGPDSGGQAFVQHYFDSRGVARVYEMSFAGSV
jgi:hypothetical protein